MSSGWDYAVASEALDFINSGNARERRRVTAVLQRLVKNPAIEPDVSFYDQTGRKISVVQLNGVDVTFWVDHFGKEVRVVDISLC